MLHHLVIASLNLSFYDELSFTHQMNLLFQVEHYNSSLKNQFITLRGDFSPEEGHFGTAYAATTLPHKLFFDIYNKTKLNRLLVR